MARLTLRYLIIVGCLLFVFANFIACGSQLYQVSMKDDFDDERAPAESKDPESPSLGIHASQGWESLPIEFRWGDSMNPSQRALITSAMKSWEMAVGKQLFKDEGTHVGVNGDSFKDLYSSLADNVNGQYLDDHWGKTKKPQVVLATTIWDNAGGNSSTISRSDIRFNNEFYLLGDSLQLRATETKEVVDIQSLALHELGHLLGLTHIEPSVDQFSVMNPNLFIGEGLTTRKLSRGDVGRIQQIYQCEGEACDLDALMAKIESSETPAVNVPAAH